MDFSSICTIQIQETLWSHKDKVVKQKEISIDMTARIRVTGSQGESNVRFNRLVAHNSYSFILSQVYWSNNKADYIDYHII